MFGDEELSSHPISHIGYDGSRGWVGSDHLYMSGENLPYQVKSFFSTDKSILLTLIENLYFTMLLIRQEMNDKDCIAMVFCIYPNKLSNNKLA